MVGGKTYKVAGKGEGGTEPMARPLELGALRGLGVCSGKGELGMLTLGESLGTGGVVATT